MRTKIALMGVIIMMACTPVPMPLTQVRGDESGLKAMEGDWEGEYWTEGVSDRAGNIYFRVGPGVDTARAEVIMLSRSARPPIVVFGRDPWGNQMLRSQVLSIRFVRATGDSIRGLMDPYTDPVCGCELRTTFRGRIRGKTAQGTFESLHEDGQRTGGRWRATRTQRVATAR